MFKPILFAILFVAASAIPLCATGQNVYKCGSSYSQTPCANGQVLNLDDARTPAQQQQSTHTARTDQKLANQLEQDRVAQEKQALHNTRQMTKQMSAPERTGAATAADAPLTKITPKSFRPKTHKPNHFVAEVPGSEKTATVKKSTQKKQAASAS